MIYSNSIVITGVVEDAGLDRRDDYKRYFLVLKLDETNAEKVVDAIVEATDLDFANSKFSRDTKPYQLQFPLRGTTLGNFANDGGNIFVSTKLLPDIYLPDHTKMDESMVGRIRAGDTVEVALDAYPYGNFDNGNNGIALKLLEIHVIEWSAPVVKKYNLTLYDLIGPKDIKQDPLLQ